MKFNRFYNLWGTFRAWAILFVIFLIIAGWITAHSYVIIIQVPPESYAYTLEMDYTGPGSEAESLDRACRDRENEKSHEKCQKGEGSERDQERSREYERDHGA